MDINVGSIGALMVMVVITLWLWRRGERPIRSLALNVALIAMVVAIVLSGLMPVVMMNRGGDEKGCLIALAGVLAAVHAVALGAFVGFILATVGPAAPKPDSQG